ncbi:hypothetical protein PHYC_00464 [Phycisphaerales bacterium]|nr:hypothetical protein PHYC_00464 [Phycisphaerales bacterium]
MTQTEFGKRIGVDSMTVSRWERGTVKPGTAAVAALNRMLCLSAALRTTWTR